MNEIISLEILSSNIKRELNQIQCSFVAIGYHLSQIQECYHPDSIATYSQNEFGLSTTSTSRFISIWNKFGEVNTEGIPTLRADFRDFSKSQLQEMLSLTDEQLQHVTSKTTVKEIRKVKLPSQKEEKIIEEPSKDSSLEFDSEAIATSQEDDSETTIIGMGTVEIDSPVQEIEQVIQPPKYELPEVDGERFHAEEIENPYAAKEKEKLKMMEHYIALGDKVPTNTIERQRFIVKAINSLSEKKDGEEMCLSKKPLVVRLSEPMESVPLPPLKNNDARKDWLRNFKEWGLWYQDEYLGIDYYRYDFPFGIKLVCEVYQPPLVHSLAHSHEQYYFHIIGEKPKDSPMGSFGVTKFAVHETYCKFDDCETELIELLKYAGKRISK